MQNTQHTSPYYRRRHLIFAIFATPVNQVINQFIGAFTLQWEEEGGWGWVGSPRWKRGGGSSVGWLMLYEAAQTRVQSKGCKTTLLYCPQWNQYNTAYTNALERCFLVPIHCIPCLKRYLLLRPARCSLLYVVHLPLGGVIHAFIVVTNVFAVFTYYIAFQIFSDVQCKMQPLEMRGYWPILYCGQKYRCVSSTGLGVCQYSFLWRNKGQTQTVSLCCNGAGDIKLYERCHIAKHKGFINDVY